jgi:hypothetical protein
LTVSANQRAEDGDAVQDACLVIVHASIAEVCINLLKCGLFDLWEYDNHDFCINRYSMIV